MDPIEKSAQPEEKKLPPVKVRYKKGFTPGFVNRLGRNVRLDEIVTCDGEIGAWLVEQGEFELVGD